MDGTFAQLVVEIVLLESIYVSLFRAAITNIWHEEQAVVVKVHPDDATVETPPCEYGDSSR